MMRTEQQDQHQDSNRILDELSSLILSIIRSSPSPEPSLRRQAARLPEMTPGGFAALLMGVSVSLMLCGSVTFLIGFMLMPWVIVIILILYFVGVLSSISMIWHAILCCNATSSPPSVKEGCSGWKLL